MAYKGVKRVITIEFDKVREGILQVNVTDDMAAVRTGDTVIWNVQGLPPVARRSVTVANFTLVEAPALVNIRNLRNPAVRHAPFPIRRMRVTPAGPSIDLRNLAPGVYKYDVVFNGKTILDPELEIRGPGGR
jgi:hypothetical protein